MREKLITYWRVKSAADATAPPEWEQLDTAPSSTAGLRGELKIENDDQIMMVFFVDETAQKRVTRSARDAASLAQEWQVPRSARTWPSVRVVPVERRAFFSCIGNEARGRQKPPR